MRPIPEEKYARAGKPILLKLFGTPTPDPFSNPFLPVVESQIIVASGVPGDDFLAAIKTAGSKLDDAGFYMHAPEPHLRPAIYEYDWYVPFDEIASFKQKTLVDHIPYVYYSPQGTWGLVTSDVHGVLGAPREFCQRICDLLPGIETEVQDFVQYHLRIKAEYPSRVDIHWLEPMLTSIYGSEKTIRLLKGDY